MRRARNYKNIIILCVFVALFVMTVGYAVYQKRLDIGGVARVDWKDWNIRILSIENVESSNGVDVVKPSHTNTTAKFNSKITKVGGYIKYKIVVKNNGTIDGVLGAINIDEAEDSVITYNIEGADIDDVLLAGEEATIYVTATYDATKIDTASTNKSNVNLNLTYVQLEGYEQTNYHSIKYRNIINSDNLVSAVHHKDNLVIDLTGYNVHYLKIYINNLETNEYSYINNILTIKNVTGDLVIMNDDFSMCNAEVVNGLIICANSQLIDNTDDFGDFEKVSGNLQVTNDGGVYFDGTTSYNYNFDASVDIKDEYTITTVVKFSTANQISSNYGTDIVSISNAVSYYMNSIGVYYNELFILSYKKGDYANKSYNTMYFDFSSYNDKKVQITITAKRNGISYVYVNGELVSQVSSPAELMDYTYITLGDLRPGRAMYWKGTMYDIKFYNRQLSSDEVVANYNKDKITYEL